MNTVVVHNPRSGTAVATDELKRYFAEAGITITDLIDITDDESSQRIRTHAVSGATIAAIGGDGTLSNVAKHIIGTDGVFAPLPGGTLNHFTKDAGVNQDLKTAVMNLQSAKPRRVDVATVNGTVFLNNSSMGVYPLSLHTRKRFEDKLGKWPAAVIGSLRAFVRFRLYDVEINGQEFRTPFLFVGNNDYHIGASGERTSLNEGKLCVYLIASDRRRDIIRLILSAIAGRLREQPDFIFFKTEQLTIHTKNARSVSVATDGEVTRMHAPLTYQSVPAGLTII